MKVHLDVESSAEAGNTIRGWNRFNDLISFGARTSASIEVGASLQAFQCFKFRPIRMKLSFSFFEEYSLPLLLGGEGGKAETEPWRGWLGKYIEGDSEVAALNCWKVWILRSALTKLKCRRNSLTVFKAEWYEMYLDWDLFSEDTFNSRPRSNHCRAKSQNFVLRHSWVVVVVPLLLWKEEKFDKDKLNLFHGIFAKLI